MFRQILRSLLSLVFAMGVFGVGVAHAAVLETSDVMERQLVSTPSNHSILLKTTTGVDAPSDTIALHFPSGFSLASLVVADLQLSHGTIGSETVETLAATPAAGVWGATISGQTITFTAPTDAAAGEVVAGHNVRIRIGTNAGGTHKITNPSGSGSFFIYIDGTFGDSGAVNVPIVTADSTTVSLTIPSSGGGGGGGGPPPGSDTTAPVLSNIQAINITQTTADITWNTNESSDSRVDYGLTMVYSDATTDATMGTSHVIHLVGLTQDTTYHFRVESKDAAGNNAISGDFTFHTLAPPHAPI